MGTPCRDATALVHQNAIQPCAESVALLIAIEGAIRAQEGRLKRVLRVVSIPQHPNRKPCTAIVIPVYQCGVSVNVTSQNALDVGGIVAHVLGYNPPPGGTRHIAKMVTRRT